MLKKNLSSVTEPDKLTKAFESLAISETVRAEELTPVEFSAIYKEIFK